MADYSVTGNPISLSRGASSLIRVEFGLIQTAIATKVDKAGGTYTGAHDMTGATVTVATQSQGDNSTKPATTAYADTIKAYANSLSMAAGNMPVGGTTGQYLKKSSETNYDASWAALSITRSARTSNTILAAADSQQLIDITSGTFSQTFTAAATLGSGWFCYIRNSGTGDITLEPDGAELIDGLTNFVMYPGEVRLVQCTGTAFTSVVLSPFFKKITTTGSFIFPPGYQAIQADVINGGNGGNRTDIHNNGAAGGTGGHRNIQMVQGVAAGTTITATIGAGGTGATANNTTGSAGGTSSFGTYVTGVAATGTYSGAAGGTASGIDSVGNPGQSSVGAAGGGGGGGDGGVGTYAGGAGGSSGTTTQGGGGTGGSSANGGVGADGVGGLCGAGGGGGSGITSGTAYVGGAGGIPGGGGGGGGAGTTSGNGGNGARGEIRVTGVA